MGELYSLLGIWANNNSTQMKQKRIKNHLQKKLSVLNWGYGIEKKPTS